MKTVRDRKTGKPYCPVYRYDGTLLGHLPIEDTKAGFVTISKAERGGWQDGKGDKTQIIRLDIVFGMQSPPVAYVNSKHYDILFAYDGFYPSEWFYGFVEGLGRRL